MIEEIASRHVARVKHPLSQGVRAGDYVFVAGQTAVLPDGTVVTGDFEAEVRAFFDDVRHAVKGPGGWLRHVCKVTVFLGNPVLLEPMNRVYEEYFAPPFPARSSVLPPLSD